MFTKLLDLISLDLDLYLREILKTNGTQKYLQEMNTDQEIELRVRKFDQVSNSTRSSLDNKFNSTSMSIVH